MRRAKRWEQCWLLTETEEASPWKDKVYRFDFSYIRSDKLRRELQDYMWNSYQTGDKMLSTLRQEQSWFRYYEAWLYLHGIDSLAQITAADAEGFLTYLHTCISRKTGLPLRLITQKHIYDTVRSIYRWYAFRQPEYREALLLFPTDVYQRINRTVRTVSATEEQTKRFVCRLDQAENPCLRYGMTILLTTGIAPGDLMRLRTDCLQTGERGISLRYYHHRNRTYRTVPVSRSCVHAVQQLQEQTKELRRMAPEECREQLFLHFDKWEQVVTPTPDLFRYWMRKLQKNEQKADTRLTCTMLRCGLVRDMYAYGMPSVIVQELTGCSLYAERGRVV